MGKNASPARQHDSLYWTLMAAGGILAALIVVVLLLFLSLSLFYLIDTTGPGVGTSRVDLSWMSRAEAVNALQKDWKSRTVKLVAGDSTQEISLAATGITLDAESTVEQAYQHGRSLESLQRLLNPQARIEIQPVWYLDAGVAKTNLESLAPSYYRAPVDAQLEVRNGQAEALQSIPGQMLDVPTTLNWLEHNKIVVVEQGWANAQLTPIEPDVTDVSQIAGKANQLFSNPPTIRLFDPITNQSVLWAPTPVEWASWLRLDYEPQVANNLGWDLDINRVQAYLEEQAKTLGEDRYVNLDEATSVLAQTAASGYSDRYVRIYHHERKHSVRQGETFSSIADIYGIPYPWIQQSNPGVSDALSEGQTLTIPSPDVLLPLPVVENKRIVVDLAEQRLWAYEGTTVKWDWSASTGISSSPTSPGVFQVQTHQQDAYASNWDLWMPHFLGIYRPVPTSDFMNGFHGFPTRSGNLLLWTNDLGHPVTYGCILVSTENASSLYQWAEDGVIVEIQN